MADERPISASPLSAQEQARIRRERRQAKVREGGNNRLSRITATQGSPDFRKDETLPPPKLPTTNSTPDPPEIDISKFNARSSPRPGSTASSYPATHFTSTTSPEDELQQAMMMDQLYRLRGASSTPATPLEGDDGEDPLMKLLQQISGCAGLPPAMMGGKPPAIVEPQQARWSMLWSVLHAAGATSLALWTLKSHVEAVGRFDGTVEQRTESINLVKSQRPQLFWYFATMELVFQSTRFLVEKGRPPQGSMLTTVARFLPQPFGTFLTTLARYSVFLWTILADAGVIIFILGVASWWDF